MGNRAKSKINFSLSSLCRCEGRRTKRRREESQRWTRLQGGSDLETAADLPRAAHGRGRCGAAEEISEQNLNIKDRISGGKEDFRRIRGNRKFGGKCLKREKEKRGSEAKKNKK